MRYFVEPMKSEDISAVVEIEKESFSLSWPSSAYKRELRNPSTNRYIVARHCNHPDSAAEHDGERPGGRKPLLSSLFPFLTPQTPHQEEHPIAGYAGLWMMVDEAHVTTIAVKPEYRGRGVGEMLLVALIDNACEMGATWVTLEVRVSNFVAQNLYKKYGFKEAGVRRRYYSDNGEDALIMWSDPIGSAAFQGRFQQLKRDLAVRMERDEEKERAT